MSSSEPSPIRSHQSWPIQAPAHQPVDRDRNNQHAWRDTTTGGRWFVEYIVLPLGLYFACATVMWLALSAI